MKDTIYVVMGYYDNYEDHADWCVCYMLDEEEAKEHVAALTKASLGILERNTAARNEWNSKERSIHNPCPVVEGNPLDPNAEGLAFHEPTYCYVEVQPRGLERKRKD